MEDDLNNIDPDELNDILNEKMDNDDEQQLVHAKMVID